LETVGQCLIADKQAGLPDDSNQEDGDANAKTFPAYLKAMNVIENVW